MAIFKEKELVEFTIQSLEDLQNYYDGYACDLHHEIFNTDYYIIGIWKAEQWFLYNGQNYAFSLIGEIQEYENNNFGEVTTDLSNPENVVNMYVYIAGEEILNNSETLNNVWDNHITEKQIQNIINELKEHYSID